MTTTYDPPVSTYIPISETTITTAISSVTFSGIDTSTYRDIVVVIEAQGSTNDNFGLRLNGDSSAFYRYLNMYGNGTDDLQLSDTGRSSLYVGQACDSPSLTTIQINDASATTRYKTVLSRWSQPLGTYAGTGAFISLWPSTDAVSSLTFVHFSGNFSTSSTFKVYGIEA